MDIWRNKHELGISKYKSSVFTMSICLWRNLEEDQLNESTNRLVESSSFQMLYLDLFFGTEGIFEGLRIKLIKIKNHIFQKVELYFKVVKLTCSSRICE